MSATLTVQLKSATPKNIAEGIRTLGGTLNGSKFSIPAARRGDKVTLSGEMSQGGTVKVNMYNITEVAGRKITADSSSNEQAACNELVGMFRQAGLAVEITGHLRQQGWTVNSIPREGKVRASRSKNYVNVDIALDGNMNYDSDQGTGAACNTTIMEVLGMLGGHEVVSRKAKTQNIQVITSTNVD